MPLNPAETGPWEVCCDADWEVCCDADCDWEAEVCSDAGWLSLGVSDADDAETWLDSLWAGVDGCEAEEDGVTLHPVMRSAKRDRTNNGLGECFIK